MSLSFFNLSLIKGQNIARVEMFTQFMILSFYDFYFFLQKNLDMKIN